MKEASKTIINWLFDNTSIISLYAVCDVDNCASIKVLESLGFILEKESDGKKEYTLFRKS
jgi:RimJ/RimL family protein N-acetyltransferase